MELTKIIFVAVISIVLSIIISNFNKEYKVYITVIFGMFVFLMIFDLIKESISEFIRIFNIYNIRMDNVGLILKIIGIAYICDFISLMCKDLSYESIGKKVEIAGKVVILIYSIDIIKVFLDQILILVNG